MRLIKEWVDDNIDHQGPNSSSNQSKFTFHLNFSFSKNHLKLPQVWLASSQLVFPNFSHTSQISLITPGPCIHSYLLQSSPKPQQIASIRITISKIGKPNFNQIQSYSHSFKVKLVFKCRSVTSSQGLLSLHSSWPGLTFFLCRTGDSVQGACQHL